MKSKVLFVLALVFILSSAGLQENKPKAEYRVGPSLVTVWENQKEGKHGPYTEKHFQVQKLYKKGDEWKSTDNFSLTELLQLRAAIDKAIDEEGVE